MTKKTNKIIFFALWGLVALAIVLRLWGLGSNPPSLNWDEASHGVNAKAILMSGKDEWGVFLPHIFRAFGDFKLPMYIYLSVPVVGIMGLSESSIRLVSAFSGLVTCFFVYKIMRHYFKNEIVVFLGLLTSLFLPWHVFLSRVALEANLSLAMVVFGMYAIFFEKKSIYRNLGLVSLALSFHTYNSARVVAPFLLIAVFVYIYREKLTKQLFIGIFTVFLSLLLVGYQAKDGTALSRYEKLNILSENNVYQIGQMREKSSLPKIVARALYNRPTYFAYRVAGNYTKYFSLGFITQTNGPQAQFAIPGQNIVLWTNTALTVIGFLYLLYRDKKTAAIVAFLLVLAFLPAAITESTPQALRPLYAIPLVVFLCANGYMAVSMSLGKNKNFVLALVFGIMLVEFGGYWWKYTNVYPKQYSSAWQYGYKEMARKVNAISDQYDRVVITKFYGEPHIFMAFWGSYPATDLSPSENNVRFKQSDWYWTDRVGKYYFVNDWDIHKNEDEVKSESGLSIPLKGSLLVTTGENTFSDTKEIDRVYDLEGRTVFVISSYEK